MYGPRGSRLGAFELALFNGGGGIVPTPTTGSSASSGPAWWEAPLGQVAQGAADWVTEELTGVPTYGGAPAQPPGAPGGVTTQPGGASGPLVILGNGATPWGTYAAIGAAGLLLALAFRRR